MSKLKDKIFRIVFGDVVGRGISFITTIYLARTLGVDSYGLIIVALSFLGYATWFADLGLTNIGGREMAKPPLKRVFRAKEIFVLKILLNVIVFVSSFTALQFLNLPKEQKELIESFAYALIPYSFILEWYYNGRQHFGKIAISKILNSSTYLILVFLFVKGSGEIQKVPYFFVLGSISSALLLGYFSMKEGIFELPSRGWHVLKDLFFSSLTIGFGTFFTQMMQLLPPILIGLVLTTKDAGLYGAAIRIIFIAMMIDRIFVQLLLPNLSQQWLENKEVAKRNLKSIAQIMILVAGIISLSIAIASPLIIDLIFGNDYSESSSLLSILCILLFATLLNSLFSFGLVAISKDKHFFYSTLSAGVIALTLILASSLTNSLTNIVIAVSISELIFALSAYFWFSKSVKLDVLPSLIGALFVGLLLFFTSTQFEYNVLFEALLSVALFSGLMLLFRIVKFEQLLWAKTKILQ